MPLDPKVIRELDVLLEKGNREKLETAIRETRSFGTACLDWDGSFDELLKRQERGFLGPVFTPRQIEDLQKKTVKLTQMFFDVRKNLALTENFAKKCKDLQSHGASMQDIEAYLKTKGVHVKPNDVDSLTRAVREQERDFSEKLNKEGGKYIEKTIQTEASKVQAAQGKEKVPPGLFTEFQTDFKASVAKAEREKEGKRIDKIAKPLLKALGMQVSEDKDKPKKPTSRR